MEGQGYKEITVHDINFESVSKSVWMWAMSVSIHEEIAELMKELFLGCARFVARLQKTEDTQTSWTSQTHSNALGKKESVGLSW